MLSVNLSKILAEKNVPHESGMWWYQKNFNPFDVTASGSPKWALTNMEHVSIGNEEYTEVAPHFPAYPEIALFKYAKVLWKGKIRYCGDCNEPQPQIGHGADGSCDGEVLVEGHSYQYHTHTLADLYSSGASLETIENYVLESLKIT